MNVYFLVEGKRTEPKIYPAWLSLLVPDLQRVKQPQHVAGHHYYLFNSNGYPTVKDIHLPHAIEDINSIGTYHYLALCIDADDVTVADRAAEIDTFLHENNITLQAGTKLVYIIQNVSIETWLLGNRKVFKRNPTDNTLAAYMKFFNVHDLDPEDMSCYLGFTTTAQFHTAYLRKIFEERNIAYSKKNPGPVLQPDYLAALQRRHEDSGHLGSFKTFLDFCTTLNRGLPFSEL